MKLWAVAWQCHCASALLGQADTAGHRSRGKSAVAQGLAGSLPAKREHLAGCSEVLHCTSAVSYHQPLVSPHHVGPLVMRGHGHRLDLAAPGTTGQADTQVANPKGLTS